MCILAQLKAVASPLSHRPLLHGTYTYWRNVSVLLGTLLPNLSGVTGMMLYLCNILKLLVLFFGSGECAADPRTPIIRQ